ncbi:uncharacterized protein [Procambarus clarkii]|uniref:uncharacterized protein n=1 Tax=Procambarus clarkii TaxID=6728 RepID=UPI00374202A1
MNCEFSPVIYFGVYGKKLVPAMHGTYITAVLFFNCAAGDLLRGVDVPQFAFAGGEATLSCTYDLRSTRLYSLKWYHNGTEFYRYVPTERNRPINIKPSHKFSVTEVFRNEHRVTLSLTRLAVSASGDYRCEVIAEHPSFRTEAATAVMTVLREPLAPPVLVGAREIYEPSELIKIGCQPRQPLYDGHAPTLQWFLEGSQVGSEWVTPYGNALQPGFAGLSLHVPGEQFTCSTEKNKCSTEKNKCSTEKNKCSTEKNKCSTEKNKCSSEKNKCSTEKNKCSTEKNKCSTEKNKCSTEKNKCSTEKNKCSTEKNKCSTEKNKCSTD